MERKYNQWKTDEQMWKKEGNKQWTKEWKKNERQKRK